MSVHSLEAFSLLITQSEIVITRLNNLLRNFEVLVRERCSQRMFCASAAGSTRKYFFSRLYYRKIFYKICYINNALHLEWIFITAGAARMAALLEWSGAKFSQSLVSSLYFFECDKCADNLILSLAKNSGFERLPFLLGWSFPLRGPFEQY